eukprot:COSAG02_NODE_8534_length_2533_cov_3.289647_1_plen_288_part_00
MGVANVRVLLPRGRGPRVSVATGHQCMVCSLAAQLLVASTSTLLAHVVGQQLPPECAPGTDGFGLVNTGQITYTAANMPEVAPSLLDDPGGNRAEIVVDCRWLLRCSDETLVPRVTFTSFATENHHDFVRAWDGTPLGDPDVHRIADLHGGRLPDPIVGFREVMTLQFVSDGTTDRWSAGDHFTATFDCTAGDPNAVHPADSFRCTMEYVPLELNYQGDGSTLPSNSRRGNHPGSVLDLDALCGDRHSNSHLASIHSPEDQEQLESFAQAFNTPAIWIGLNDIESGE